MPRVMEETEDEVGERVMGEGGMRRKSKIKGGGVGSIEIEGRKQWDRVPE